MTYAPTDVRLDPHPEGNTVVLAQIDGPRQNAARQILLAHSFRPAPGPSPCTLVLVRVDGEEAHYGVAAARALREEGITVVVDFDLQQDFGREWAWGDYPMPWLTRQEIREVGAEAQKIHDDIASGRLTIHYHAHDGYTTVAVGTYTGSHSVHLHGEDHLRQVARTFVRQEQAVEGFALLYGDAVRPGPAPATGTEQRVARILNPTATPDNVPELTASATEVVPVYAAEPGDHEALLSSFLNEDGEWEKYRPHDETTIASHESLRMRVEFVHEPGPGEPAWTISAYESPVGERLWHATATASTPVPIVGSLLDGLLSGAAWMTEPALTEETIALSTLPLAEAGWAQTVDGPFLRWAAPRGDVAGVRFDAFAAQARTGRNSRTWTLWGGGTTDHPVWALHLSPQAPADVLHELVLELAQRRCRQPAGRRRPPVRPAAGTRLEAPAPAVTVSPPAPAHVSAGPHRQAR